LVASELGQRDTRRSHVPICANLAVATRRAALVRRLAPADTNVAFGTGRVLQADLSGVAVLLIATLFGSVALRHALTLEVADVRLDRAVVSALTLVRHTDMGTASLAAIAVGSSIDTADR
jgi:hypothetical protein